MSGTQENFLRAGGPMSAILEAKYATGELERSPPFREYPKSLRISRGVQKIPRHTDIIEGTSVRTHRWEDEREVFDDVVVASEEEEERVLTGGKTSAEIEAERQGLIEEAKRRGLMPDPDWTLVRLQRALGAAPERDAIEKLQQKIADLEEKTALQQRVAELEAQLANPSAPPPAEPKRRLSLNMPPDGSGPSGSGPSAA